MSASCAICNPDRNPSSMRLCRTCRDRPENDGWSEGDRLSLVPLRADEEPMCWLSDLQGTRAKEVPALLPKIVALLKTNVTVKRRPQGRLRYRQEWVEISRPPTLAEIARQLGVTRRAVSQSLNRYFGRNGNGNRK